MTSSSRSLGVKLLLGTLLLAGCGGDQPAENGVDAMVRRASAEMRKGEYVQAKKELDPAVVLAGNDPDVLELSGQIAYRLQDLTKARAAFTALASNLAFDKTARSHGYTGLGVLDYAGIKPNGVQDEAVAKARMEFRTAIVLDNRNAAAHYNLGRLYADFLHFPEFARDEFMLFTHLAPATDARVAHVRDEVLPALKAKLAENLRALGKGKTPGVAEAEAAVKKAKTAEAKGQLQEAKRQYQLASEIRPSDANVLLALGGVAERMGSPAVAEQAYSRAVAAAPGTLKATALRRLEATLRKNGKPRVANVYKRYADSLAAGKR